MPARNGGIEAMDCVVHHCGCIVGTTIYPTCDVSDNDIIVHSVGAVPLASLLANAALCTWMRAGAAPRAPRWVGEPPPRPPANDACCAIVVSADASILP